MCPVFWRSCGRGNRSPIVATRSSSLRNTGRPVKSRAKAADMASAPVRWSGGQTATKPKAYPLEDGCSPGTLYPVWNKGKWRFGINICNDTNYPQAADQLIRQGANLICAPINNMLRPKKAEIWRVRSVENLRGCARRTGCWIVSADVAGQGNDGWFSYGCTVIVQPDGTIASRTTELVEDVAVFDLP
jgi:predicted amidohydrolase